MGLCVWPSNFCLSQTLMPDYIYGSCKDECYHKPGIPYHKTSSPFTLLLSGKRSAKEEEQHHVGDGEGARGAEEEKGLHQPRHLHLLGRLARDPRREKDPNAVALCRPLLPPHHVPWQQHHPDRGLPLPRPVGPLRHHD